MKGSRVRLILLITTVGCLLVGVGVAAWKGREIYRFVKQERAEMMLPKIHEAMEKGEWNAALEKMNEAFRLAPQHPPVIREMAELLKDSRRDAPTVIALIERLEQLDALTSGDRIIRARTMVQLGRLDEAGSEAEKLLAEGEERALALGVLAQVALARGDNDAAEKLLSEAVKEEPENFTLRLGLAATRARSEFSEVRASAQADLWKVAQEPDLNGIRALAVLGGEVGIPAGKEIEYVQLLREHPFAKDKHHLEALRIVLQLEPQNRDALLGEELALWERRPITEQLEFYKWLLDIGHPEVVVEGLDLEEAKKNPELFRIYIGALLNQGSWEVAETALKESDVPLGQGQLHFVRANIAREAGAPADDIRNELRRAVEFAGVEKFPGLALKAGEMGEVLGFSDVAESGFRSALRAPGLEVIAMEKLAALARRSGNSEVLLAVVSGSNVPEALRETAYLKLLLGIEIELQASAALEAFARDQNSAEWHLAAALGKWRMGAHDEAKALAETLVTRLRANGLDVGKRAVLSGILGRELPSLDGAYEGDSDLGSLLLPAEKAFPGLP